MHPYGLPELGQKGGSAYFRDDDEQLIAAGAVLAIDGEQMAAVVLSASAEYAAGGWTRLGCRAALARAVRERQECVPFPGLLTGCVPR